MAVKTLLPRNVNVEVRTRHDALKIFTDILHRNVAKVGVRTGFGIAYFKSLWGPQKPLRCE